MVAFDDEGATPWIENNRDTIDGLRWSDGERVTFAEAARNIEVAFIARDVVS